MTLTDGRGELYQWDTGRTLTVDDATVTQVHFQNRAYGRTIDVDVNNSVAIIPDEILQKPGELRVYAFSGTAESGFTKVEQVFNVARRNKPNDYMFTPTEQKSLEGLQKQIGDLSELNTDAKADLVAAINETATAGQTLGLTGATVGQVPAVKAVDGNGAPTEWEAVELPSGAYTVNLTMGDGGNITADKTFSEIKAAYDNGKVVDAKFADAIVPLCSISDSDAFFAQTNANSNGVYTASLICTPDNVWSMSQDGFDASTTLGISGAAAGQIVKIKTVDSSGIPTEWEPADMPSGGGGTDTSLGVTGATVGQTVKIKAVGENGAPTEWEAADLASGGVELYGNREPDYYYEVTEEISALYISEINGNPFSANKFSCLVEFPAGTGGFYYHALYTIKGSKDINYCVSNHNAPDLSNIASQDSVVFITVEKLNNQNYLYLYSGQCKKREQALTGLYGSYVSGIFPNSIEGETSIKSILLKGKSAFGVGVKISIWLD